MGNPFYNRDVISVTDFKREDLELLFRYTDKLKERSGKEEIGKGKILGYLFFEPSTRTRISFEAAMATIGGSSIGIADVRSSSLEKGESFADTIKVLDSYSDILVVRHRLDGSAKFAAEIAEKPVINAGSGTEEHPTQAMLDLYTIMKEKGRIDNLNIGIVGDLKYGRTVYSLLYALANYNVDIYLISPPMLKVRKESLYGLKLDIKEYERLEDIISKLDVIYVTRIQRERFPDQQEYERVRGSYVIDAKIMSNAKSDAIVMHPLPKIDEISKDIDNTLNARYFRQAAYGKDVRTSLLALILHEDISALD